MAELVNRRSAESVPAVATRCLPARRTRQRHRRLSRGGDPDVLNGRVTGLGSHHSYTWRIRSTARRALSAPAASTTTGYWSVSRERRIFGRVMRIMWRQRLQGRIHSGRENSAATVSLIEHAVTMPTLFGRRCATSRVMPEVDPTRSASASTSCAPAASAPSSLLTVNC